MIDEYEGFQPGLTGPVIAGEAILPSDTADLAYATRGIYVGGAGDLTVVLISGEEVTLRGVQAGVIYPLRVKRVNDTGTTATELVGLR